MYRFHAKCEKKVFLATAHVKAIHYIDAITASILKVTFHAKLRLYDSIDSMILFEYTSFSCSACCTL